jgi:group I intron endonuclease
MYYIYIHQNKINKKIYVGYSANPKSRWQSTKSHAFNPKSKAYNYVISKAIRKYGWDNFDHKIIEQFDCKGKALEAEKFWIKFFKSNILVYGGDYGYNLHEGGNCPPDQTGHKHTDKVKMAISNAQKGNTRGCIFTDEQYVEMIKLYNSGTPPKDIQKIFNCSNYVIYKALKRAGLPTMGHKFRQLRERTKLEPEIIKLYLDGITYSNIIKQLGCSQTTIVRVINRNNLPKRSKK